MQHTSIDEERWRLALDNADFGIWDLDPRAELVHYTPQWKARLGFAQADVADSTAFWRSRVHPDDLSPMLGALRAHLDGFTPTYEMRFRLQAHNRYLTVLSRGRVVERDVRGDAVRMVGTMVELSAETLPLPTRDAVAANAPSMRHELRTPLNVILGFSQLMRARLGRASLDEQREQLGYIEEAGQRLLAQLDDLLELARRDAGGPARARAGRSGRQR